jgi:hypothetical protein
VDRHRFDSVPGARHQHGNSDPDPDPHQNDAGPQHWVYSMKGMRVYEAIYVGRSGLTACGQALHQHGVNN